MKHKLFIIFKKQEVLRANYDDTNINYDSREVLLLQLFEE